MGLILDTNILIASDRRRGTVTSMLTPIKARFGEIDIAISAVTVVEFTHGIFRAKTPEDRSRRRIFAEQAFQELLVHPVTFEIAQLAGRIDGEQNAKGITIEFQDLIIGATALHLGYDVLTLNVRHFQMIPGLNVLTL